jgi:predicted metal-dependent HD superfamily phosphohydrolase
MTESMIEAWVVLIGGEHGRAAGLDLLARYAEPHRRYHTVRHLAEVLAIVDELAGQAQDADAVRLAAWFHDAIYTIGSAPGISNEEASARFAELALADLGVPAARISEAARLVRLTETHRVEPADHNAAVLCDADLAILGAAPERYREYTREVRQEYAEIPEEDFRRGRAAILRPLLDGRVLFHTDAARERYEARARANLAAEIEALLAP